jgi:lipopolysaccharide export system protein LptA
MTVRAALRVLAAAATLALGAGGAAHAQLDTRSTAPIDTTADEMEVVNSQCLVIFRGAAEAMQGKSRLRAHTISVYSRPKGASANGQPNCGGTDRIVADGEVYFVTPDQNARGDHAVYTSASDQIVMTGNVIVVQGNNVARGDRLTIHVATKAAKLESDTHGRGQPHRVRGVFYPEKNENGAPASPAQGSAPGDAAAPPSGL